MDGGWEFKLTDPDEVAGDGESANKPKMNYEKIGRGLGKLLL
jgi:hypothetical protein